MQEKKYFFMLHALDNGQPIGSGSGTVYAFNYDDAERQVKEKAERHFPGAEHKYSIEEK